MVPAETRAYRSALRAQQAAHTRARIVAAAAEQFATQGFQATTLAAIARSAGVSVETVKTSASKAELLIAAFERAFAGEEGTASIAETERAAGLIHLADDVFTVSVVATIADANARAHALWTVLCGAALSDDTVSRALASMLAHRRADFELFVTELRRRELADDVDVAAAAAELSFLMSPEGYTQLVGQSGWTDDRYRAWLTERVADVAARGLRPGEPGRTAHG